MSFISLSTLF